MMDEKTQGAWIIHHTNKLASVTIRTCDYDRINFAGKCGLILSGLAATKQIIVPKKRVDAIASSAGISPKVELPTILDELEKQRVIDIAKNEISVLGITTHETLNYTFKIFSESNPSEIESASIYVSETASKIPVIENGFGTSNS
jgi:hypothetical protein